MAGPQPQVRFKLAWQNYRVGDVITPNASHRDWLIANGYVERLDANEAATPARPGKLAGKAARKLVDAGKGFFSTGDA